MAEGNGNGKWSIWMAGIIFTLFLTALTMLGSNVIANDKDSRDRDLVICTRVEANTIERQRQLEGIRVEQMKINQEILIALSTIKTDLEYLKKK